MYIFNKYGLSATLTLLFIEYVSESGANEETLVWGNVFSSVTSLAAEFCKDYNLFICWSWSPKRIELHKSKRDEINDACFNCSVTFSN